MTGRRPLSGRLRLAAVAFLTAPVVLATACTDIGQPVDAAPTGPPTPHSTPDPSPAPEPTTPPEDVYLDLEFEYDTAEHDCLPPETFDTLHRIDPDTEYELQTSRSSEYEQSLQTLVCSYLRADLAGLIPNGDDLQPTHVFITTVTWLHREQPAGFGSGTVTTIPLASHDLLDWFDTAWSGHQYDDWRETCWHHHRRPCETLESLPAHGPGMLLSFDGHVGNLQVTADITYAGADLPDQEQANETMTGIYRDIVLAEIERRPHQERTP